MDIYYFQHSHQHTGPFSTTCATQLPKSKLPKQTKNCGWFFPAQWGMFHLFSSRFILSRTAPLLTLGKVYNGEFVIP